METKKKRWHWVFALVAAALAACGEVEDLRGGDASAVMGASVGEDSGGTLVPSSPLQGYPPSRPESSADAGSVPQAVGDVSRDASADGYAVADAPPAGPPSPWGLSGVVSVTSAAYESFSLLFEGRHDLAHVYRRATAHTGTTDAIELTRSEDEGATWSAPVEILTPPPTEGYEIGSGGVLPGGTFVVAYWRMDWSTSPVRDLGVYTVRSTDDGRTWAAPAKVPLNVQATYGSVVVTPDGPALSMTTAISGAERTYLVFTHDDGVTWSDAREVRNAVVPHLFSEEDSFLWVGGQTIIGFARAARGLGASAGDGTYLAMRSEDMGRTWEFRPSSVAPSSLPPGTTFSTWNLVSPHLFSSAPGEATLLVAERQQLSPGPHNVGILRAVTFPTGQAPWSTGQGQELWRDRFVDFGYPRTAPVAGGFRVVWFSEQYPAGPENLFFGTMSR